MINDVVLRRNDDNYIKVHFKALESDYIDKIMELQESVYNGLEDKDLFVKSDKSSFLECIEGKGRIIGCLTEEDELIAIGVYIRYGMDKENYGYDLNISEKELLKVAQIECTIVKEEYRGNRLQKIICNELEIIANSDKMKIISATVSPKNKYSLNTFLSLGYKIEIEKEKYGGFLRYVLSKNIH